MKASERESESRRVPGATETVLCTHCAAAVHVQLRGGIHRLHCAACGRRSKVEVCFNGSEWLVRLEERE